MKLLRFVPFIALAACNSNNSLTSANNTIAPQQEVARGTRHLSSTFKDYWYGGTAEISSYDLQQARYGEMRNGTAIMVFVTEPMDLQGQVKADRDVKTNISVMKLNATRDFNTGIYPYTIMSSTFLPLDARVNAIKITASVQEWCGHTYMQFNNRGARYEVALHSYFQSEGDTTLTLPNVVTENQLPLQLRLDPAAMPQGNFKLIPSAEFLRLKHVKTAAIDVAATLTTHDKSYEYRIDMPALDRTVTYVTEQNFPYRILSWSDRYKEGANYMETTAVLKKTIQSAYWSKNRNEDEPMRNDLGL
jgi:hypothetical protein